jgi:hypothetical protein
MIGWLGLWLTAANAGPARTDLNLVVPANRPWIVLRTGEAPAENPVRIHAPSPNDPLVVERAEANALNANERAWVGRPVWVADADGACETRIQGLAWTRSARMPARAGGEASNEELSAALAQAPWFLVGTLAPGCGLSTADRAAAWRFFQPSAPKDELRAVRIDRANRLFAALPAVRTLADAHPEARVPQRVAQVPLGTQRFVLATWTAGCASELGGVWALWRVNGGDEGRETDTDWHVVAVQRTDGAIPAPHLATDLDLNGVPELYGPGQVWRTDSVGLRWDPSCPTAP